MYDTNYKLHLGGCSYECIEFLLFLFNITVMTEMDGEKKRQVYLFDVCINYVY